MTERMSPTSARTAGMRPPRRPPTSARTACRSEPTSSLYIIISVVIEQQTERVLPNGSEERGDGADGTTSDAEDRAKSGEDEVEEVANKLGELSDGDLGGVVDVGEDNFDGLADESVDVRDGSAQDALEVVDDRGERIDGAVRGGDELCGV